MHFPLRSLASPAYVPCIFRLSPLHFSLMIESRNAHNNGHLIYCVFLYLLFLRLVRHAHFGKNAQKRRHTQEWVSEYTKNETQYCVSLYGELGPIVITMVIGDEIGQLEVCKGPTLTTRRFPNEISQDFIRNSMFIGAL